MQLDASFPSGEEMHVFADPQSNSYSIQDLEPFTLYKFVMSAETRVGQSQNSSAIYSRTAEGSK